MSDCEIPSLLAAADFPTASQEFIASLRAWRRGGSVANEQDYAHPRDSQRDSLEEQYLATSRTEAVQSHHHGHKRRSSMESSFWLTDGSKCCTYWFASETTYPSWLLGPSPS